MESTAGLLVSRSLATTSYGVFYMTSLVSVVFWAMLCLQTFWYFGSYESDRKSLKFLVVFLWSISTAQTYVIVYGAWVYMIDNFGNYRFLQHMVSPYVTQFIFAAIATVTVQAFFVVRICRLSGNKLWMVVVVWAPLAIFQIVCAFIIVIKTCLSGKGSYAWAPLPKDLGIAYLAVSLFIDIAIAVFLLELLRRHQKQTRVRSTLKIIQRLMLLAVLNMLWTTAFAICDLITFVALHKRIIYILFDMPICSLYCNTLLANLNTRASLGERQSAVEEMDLTTLDAVEHQPVALKLKNGHKVSTQSGSRMSSELAA
ncbi:hypothetical protein DEU56DRAFT_910528 [Suillus clintonianus]|uniref:uncharacterized protein n=1 Tax=Suillus clintonianus TaxID=1904413 RepID=UPI001B86C881|nr:uncharacterized protein DEU56DRAFT_910528 [Suillus clintonianus]KAG2144600.1 hypothetical protein DEU56DRAFT_910528 [Suillus clintonianus]